jgi:hypothetical protein
MFGLVKLPHPVVLLAGRWLCRLFHQRAQGFKLSLRAPTVTRV